MDSRHLLHSLAMAAKKVQLKHDIIEQLDNLTKRCNNLKKVDNSERVKLASERIAILKQELNVPAH